MSLLKVNELHVYYGSIHAIKGISFEVHEGEVVTLIGANGAGKSTTLNSVAGLIKLGNGTVEFNGKILNGIPAHKIVKEGMALCPEGRRIFQQLTVKENLEMGAYIGDGSTLDADINNVYELFPRLKERYKQIAGTLSGGEQQMLAIGRALMSKPKMLLLDEPSMGLSPLLVKEVFKTIVNVNKTGVTVLLVEQNAKMALNIADRGYVIETGNITMEGKASDLASDPKVRQAYLGGVK